MCIFVMGDSFEQCLAGWKLPGEFTHNIPSEGYASSFIRGFLGCSSTNLNHQITTAHIVSHIHVTHWLHFRKNAEYNTLLCGKNIVGIPSRSLSPRSTSSSVRLWKAFMSLLETDFLLPRWDVNEGWFPSQDARYVTGMCRLLRIPFWCHQVEDMDSTKLRILVTCPSSAFMLELRVFFWKDW